VAATVSRTLARAVLDASQETLIERDSAAQAISDVSKLTENRLGYGSAAPRFQHVLLQFDSLRRCMRGPSRFSDTVPRTADFPRADVSSGDSALTAPWISSGK
jgi:hypothetical protein